MVRHTRRPHPYGGGRGRGESHGGTGNASHLVQCHHCNISHPRHRFPKKVLVKYDKRLARGDAPSSIRVICFDCCQRPPGSIAAAGPGSSSSSTAAHSSDSGNIKPLAAPTPHTTAARGLGPGPRAERRGCCTVCRVEYPLTVSHFPRGDLRVQAMESGRRVCFPCRTKQCLEQAIDDAVPDSFVEQAESEEEAIYVSESEDNGEEDSAPIARIEDASKEKQLEAAKARKEYSRVSTDVRAALTRARELRLHHRFVPFFLTLQRDKLKRAQQQLDALAMMSWSEVRARNAHWGIRRPADETFFEAQVEINLGIINEFDIAIQPLPQAVEFADPFLPREPQHDSDEDEDDEQDDSIEFRHLSEREKVIHLETLRAQQHAQKATPPRSLDRKEVEQVIDDDLINRFEMNVAIAQGGIAKAEAPVDSFEMICLLRALNEHVEKPRKATSSGADMPKAMKKLRFADDA
ncbi:Verprolin [Pseudozyma hubeiensis]|nr:Verprolin [Pseudozyma hubeiensis]KAJ9476325.1 Verprolin [Pseudozyma hubeiensis]KAJ9478963.1 Verprolin [Pseudozyma hubeiensis]